MDRSVKARHSLHPSKNSESVGIKYTRMTAHDDQRKTIQATIYRSWIGLNSKVRRVEMETMRGGDLPGI